MREGSGAQPRACQGWERLDVHVEDGWATYYPIAHLATHTAATPRGPVLVPGRHDTRAHHAADMLHGPIGRCSWVPRPMLMLVFITEVDVYSGVYTVPLLMGTAIPLPEGTEELRCSYNG